MVAIAHEEKKIRLGVYSSPSALDWFGTKEPYFSGLDFCPWPGIHRLSGPGVSGSLDSNDVCVVMFLRVLISFAMRACSSCSDL